MSAVRVLHLFANYKWTGPADPAIRSAARLRALGLDVSFAQAEFVHPGGEHRVREELQRRQLPVVKGLIVENIKAKQQKEEKNVPMYITHEAYLWKIVYEPIHV